MSVIRHYPMVVKPEAVESFVSAIEALAAALKDLPGFEGASFARDAEQPHRFVFDERWASIDAHKSAGATLPRELFGPLMAALAEPLAGSYLTPLPL